MVKKRTAFVALSVVLLAVGLSACSQTSEEERVAERINAYTQAASNSDSEQACGFFIPAHLQHLEENLGTSCADSVGKGITEEERQKAREMKVDPKNIVINGDTATIPAGEQTGFSTEMILKKIDGQWYGALFTEEEMNEKVGQETLTDPS